MFFPTVSVSDGKRCRCLTRAITSVQNPLAFLLLLLFLFRKSYSLEPSRSLLSGGRSRRRESAPASTTNLIPAGLGVQEPRGSQERRQRPIHAETPERGPPAGAEGWTPHFLLGKRTQTTRCQAHAHTMYAHTHAVLGRQPWAARLSSVYSRGVPPCPSVSASPFLTRTPSDFVSPRAPPDSPVPSKSHWG